MVLVVWVVQLKYRERVLGLILVSPICQAPSWSEWIYNKALINLLYYWGMTNIVKEAFLQRYFGPVLLTTPHHHAYSSPPRLLLLSDSARVLNWTDAWSSGPFGELSGK